jgi:transposase
MLVNEFKPAIQSKSRRVLSKRVLLIHDNARPHAAADTVDTLHALKFEVLEHPPYSPDLAPSDFHLFGHMKEHLRGQKFADDEVMEAVQSWLKATPKSSFVEGIHKLLDRGTKCVAKQGDYDKK